MEKYKCKKCGYIYDEVQTDKKWEKIPEDWCCPLCHYPKKGFILVEDDLGAIEEVKIGRAHV